MPLFNVPVILTVEAENEEEAHDLVQSNLLTYDDDLEITEFKIDDVMIEEIEA